MIEKKRAKFLLAIFSSILAVDVITKWMTHYFLKITDRQMLPFPYGGIGVFENFHGISFSLNHQVNSGAAWGMFPNSHQTLLYIRIAIIVVLALYILLFNKNLKSQIPFVLIISGAMGNVMDSIFYGHVVDLFFFQFWGYDFPIFNVADSFIFLGVAWLSILNLKSDSKKSSSPRFTHESKPFDSPPYK